MRILLIEDDMVLGAARRDQLVGDGHSVDQVQRLDAAHTALASVSYDLVLLDLTLPGGILIPFFKNKINTIVKKKLQIRVIFCKFVHTLYFKELNQMTNIVLIGCGEVGLCYAKAFVDAGFTVSALIDEQPSSALSKFAQTTGSSVLQGPNNKLGDADLVVSCVFGGVALEVLKKFVPWMRRGAVFADFTTADPDDMKQAHQHAMTHGIQFVDVAIMGAISASRSSTPLICAGEDCSVVLNVMQQCTSPIRQVGTKPGEAATLKLLRSIFTKGLEALSIECLMAAEEKGLRPQLYDVLSDIDQMSLKDFMELSVRTHVIHAKRRLKEVQEAKKLMKSLALNPLVLDGVEYFFGRTSDQFHTMPTSEKTLESSLSWLGSISKSTQSNPTGRSA